MATKKTTTAASKKTTEKKAEAKETAVETPVTDSKEEAKEEAPAPEPEAPAPEAKETEKKKEEKKESVVPIDKTCVEPFCKCPTKQDKDWKEMYQSLGEGFLECTNCGKSRYRPAMDVLLGNVFKKGRTIFLVITAPTFKSHNEIVLPEDVRENDLSETAIALAEGLGVLSEGALDEKETTIEIFPSITESRLVRRVRKAKTWFQENVAL